MDADSYPIGALVTLNPAERAVLVHRLLAENPMSYAELGAALDIYHRHIPVIERCVLLRLNWGLEQEFPKLNSRTPGV